MTTPVSDNDRRVPTLGILLSLAGIAVIWVIGGYCFPQLGSSHDYPPSSIGDQFGAVNALFSGLAFGGLLWALWLQRQELALQRNELALTRTELQRSALAQEASRVSLQSQVRMQLVSNQLAALNAVIAHIDNEIAERSRTLRSASDLLARRDDCIKRIGLILSQIDNSPEGL